MNQERGFVQTIVILVLVIVILSLLGISIKGIFDKLAENQVLGENFTYVWNWTKGVFSKYFFDHVVDFKNFIINLIISIFKNSPGGGEV